MQNMTRFSFLIFFLLAGVATTEANPCKILTFLSNASINERTLSFAKGPDLFAVVLDPQLAVTHFSQMGTPEKSSISHAVKSLLLTPNGHVQAKVTGHFSTREGQIPKDESFDLGSVQAFNQALPTSSKIAFNIGGREQKKDWTPSHKDFGNFELNPSELKALMDAMGSEAEEINATFKRLNGKNPKDTYLESSWRITGASLRERGDVFVSILGAYQRDGGMSSKKIVYKVGSVHTYNKIFPLVSPFPFNVHSHEQMR